MAVYRILRDRGLLHLLDLFAVGRGVRCDPGAIALIAWFWPKEIKRTSGAGDHMIREPRFTDDVAELPTHKFGPRA